MQQDSSDNTGVRPVPGYLIQRYRGWKATEYAENATWYRRLADDGQHPRCMMICCCDSRVDVTHLFGAVPGEFFMHRNISNLVPPYEPGIEHHGTSAAIEYAIESLHVANIIVAAHALCGGVRGCHAMCSGDSPALEKTESFVGRWLDLLRPGYERVKHIESLEEQYLALERQTVMVSLDNLRTFPFVREAVAAGRLALNGMWIDMANGEIEVLDEKTGAFVKV